MKQIKLFTIPNCITLCNLLCGAMAAVTALTGGNLKVAFVLVVVAALCDFLDGLSARMLNSYSGIGVELDSLADMVSFGFAPSAMLYALYERSLCHWSWSEGVVTAGSVVLFVVAAFSALRLAKFNVDDTQHEEFVGLPTPASALLIGSLGWLVEQQTLELGREAIVLIALVVALLLVAPVRLFSFKFTHFGWKGNALRYLFILAAVLLFVWAKVAAIPLIILLYIVTSLLRGLLCRGVKE